MNYTATLFEGLAPILWLAAAVFTAIMVDAWGAKPKRTFESKQPRLQLTKLEVEQGALNRN